MRIGPLGAVVAATLMLLSGCGGLIVAERTDRADSTALPVPTAPDELGEDEQSAISSTDGFWRRAFPEEFGGAYQPPIVLGGYVGDAGPACGSQRSVGDAWVYLIIADEWAHAIQARLQRNQVSIAAELQADCLAGATLRGAQADLIAFGHGDEDELAQTLAAVADEFPWTDERDHGDARERIGFFQDGLQNGVGACIAGPIRSRSTGPTG